MKKQQESTALTRREALKALAAATGGLSLSQLPPQWQTPLIEVGALPAHAQISPQVALTPTPTSTPPVLTNTRVGLPLGTCDAGNGTVTGNIYVVSADYNDPDGQIIVNQARVVITSTFPAGSSRSVDIPLGPTNITGNGFSGSISAALCIDFEGEASVTLTLTLFDAAGLASGADSVIVNKP